MTIFSAIKYPIHSPITREQLEALPCALYEEWVECIARAECVEGRPSTAYTLSVLSTELTQFAVFFNIAISPGHHDYYIKDLRKRIAKLEE